MTPDCPRRVTLDGFTIIKEDVAPDSDKMNVLESNTTLLVGLETTTELVADPLDIPSFEVFFMVSRSYFCH